MSYPVYERKVVPVTSLKLDPANQRIPDTEEKLTQKGLLTKLASDYDVVDLAKKIVNDGFIPNEAPFVVEEDGSYIVIEGNRRVAALKLLLDPSPITGEDIEKQIKKLRSNLTFEEISTVEVYIYSKRQDIEKMVVNRHIGESPILKWKTLRQTNYIYKRIHDGGYSIDDLVDLGFTKAKVYKLLRLEDMYQRAKRLNLPDEVMVKLLDEENFDPTNLERIYASNPGKAFLGINYQNHAVRITNNARFERYYPEIVTQVANGDINSRNAKDKPMIKKIINDIEAELPLEAPKENNPSLFSDTTEAKAKGNKGKGGSTPLASPPPSRKGGSSSKSKVDSDKLIQRTFTAKSSKKRINKVIGELKDLSISTFPNSTAIVLRVLLDLCTEHYIIETGQGSQLNKMKGVNTSPTLHNRLSFITKGDNSTKEGDNSGLFDSNNNLKQAVKTFISAKNTPHSLHALNMHVHNKYLQPQVADLHVIWERLGDFISLLLTKLETK